MTKKEQKENIVDDSSITKNFTAILKSFRQWIPGASHQHYDAKDDSTSEEEESAETRRENRRQSYRNRRLRRTKSTRTNNSLRHSRSSKTSKTTEKECTQSRIKPNKQLPAIPQNIRGSTEIPPKRDAIISTSSHPLPLKQLQLAAPTKSLGNSLTEKLKPVIPQETSKLVTKKKSIHIVNDIPQEHQTRLAAEFDNSQKLRMSSSEDMNKKSTKKSEQKSRERKRSSCEITLSQTNLNKIGTLENSAAGSANVVTGSPNIGTSMTHGFSQNDLDEAEKLFKTDSKFASLFQAAEVSTSPSEDSEASSASEDSNPEAGENLKKNSRRTSRLQKIKQSDHRDSGISSNRNEDEELTILPMEIEIIQANRDEEAKKNKPRIKANSAGQEPPAVPPKPQYVRTFSMTSVSNASSMESVNHLSRNQIFNSNSNLNKRVHTWSLSSVNSDASDLLSRPFSLPHPNLVQFNQFSLSSPDVSLAANQNRPSSEPPSTTNNDSLSPPLNPKKGNETGVLKRNNNSSLIKQIHVGKNVGKSQQGLIEKSDGMVSVTDASKGPNVIDPIKRSVAEDSGIATNNESANEKPSSRKRSAREIAQLYEQLKSKHIQRKREWNQEREMLLMRCKATENSQQVLRNVRGILEQLRAELKREENRRNELEREFLQNKILWDRERKELHEEIYELQRTEQMWLQHGDVPDSRVAVLHKKVQELRNEKLSILKMAEIEKMNWEEQKQQLLIQLRQHGVTFQPNGQINPNGISSELNDRLEGALQQIETVSRQLYSVQDSSKVNFQNGTLIGQQNRQMSASTSCLPEMNQQRPKSSFDLVRHAREKEASQPPQREIFSDAPELTTDDENRLPGLHKQLLFGSKTPTLSRKGIHSPR